MEAYLAAIARACAGKRVLDVGTGPDALLAIAAANARTADVSRLERDSLLGVWAEALAFRARVRDDDTLALQAGATHVTALECSAEAAAMARAAVERASLQDKIVVLEGYSTTLALPRVDVVVHEIVGDIGSEEGVAAMLADLRARPDVVDSSVAGWSVPRVVETLVAPINLRLSAAADGGDGPVEARLPMTPPVRPLRLYPTSRFPARARARALSLSLSLSHLSLLTGAVSAGRAPDARARRRGAQRGADAADGARVDCSARRDAHGLRVRAAR